MNLEAQVISAVCANKDISAVFADGTDELFTTHKDVWNALKNYYYKYKAIPDVSVLTDRYRDFEAVAAPADTSFYVEQLRNEFIGSRLRDILKSGAISLSGDSSPRVLEKLQQELGSLNKFTNSVRDLDLMDYESAERYYALQAERAAAMGGSVGIPTGFKAIDTAYHTGMAPGHLIVVIGWPGKGKEECVNKKIPTPTGFRRFGDLRPGDLVWGLSGDPVLVTGNYPQGRKTIYRVSFSDGTVTDVGRDHLWSIYLGTRGKNRNNLVTMTTQEVLDRGLFRDRDGHKEYKAILPLPEPVKYDKVDLPLDPYVMGALIGDGSYGGTSVRLTNNDEEIAAEIAARLPEYPVVETRRTTARNWTIQKLIGVFKDNNWRATKSDKRIPAEYMTAHYEARLDLLRGLMDTDGFAGYGNRQAEFSQSNEALAYQVAELVRSLGGVAKVSESSTRPGQYTVKLWTPDNPFLLRRKAAAYTPKRPMIKAFESIEITDDTEMMCISVDAEDSLYLTEDYTVTHNTWATAKLAVNAWAQGFKPMIVSLEMSPETMRDRVYTVMGEGRFRNSQLTRGEVNIDDFHSWSKRNFADKDGFIVVSNEGVGDVTPNVVQSKIDRHKPDLVICDYHQLFMDNRKSEAMTPRAMNISRELKLLAVSNNIPVVDITAATMEETSDQNDPPMLSQVAWSKAIEYDADMAFAVHRVPDTNVFELVSRKNRHGNEFDFFVEWEIDSGVIREAFDSPR